MTTNTTHNDKRGRKGQTFAPFLFALYDRKGKSKKRQSRKGKTMQEDKQRQPEQSRTKGQKQSKRIKTGANTPQAPKPPNHSRTQKPHNPRKARNQYKPTRDHQNPVKTPKNAKQGHICSQPTTSKAAKRPKGWILPIFANISKIARDPDHLHQ